MKLVLLADIHANLTALEAVLAHADAHYGAAAIAHLGDAVDYGMRPNETLARLAGLGGRIVVNLAGNHERAWTGRDVERFSSPRGAAACRHTQQVLGPEAAAYIRTALAFDPQDQELAGRRCLFVHGDLADPFWGKMPAAEMARPAYTAYDYVVCGHTHVSMLWTEFRREDSPRARRGKTRTVFINPGSVGQPRNHNPAAQYAVLDLAAGAVHFHAVPYAVAAEQALYRGEIDPFYGERLALGV